MGKALLFTAPAGLLSLAVGIAVVVSTPKEEGANIGGGLLTIVLFFASVAAGAWLAAKAQPDLTSGRAMLAGAITGGIATAGVVALGVVIGGGSSAALAAASSGPALLGLAVGGAAVGHALGERASGRRG